MLQEEMKCQVWHQMGLPHHQLCIYGTHRDVSFDFKLRINSQVGLKHLLYKAEAFVVNLILK
jgi:hypothetical protein